MLIPVGSDNQPDVGPASSNYELIRCRPCLQFRYVSGALLSLVMTEMKVDDHRSMTTDHTHSIDNSLDNVTKTIVLCRPGEKLKRRRSLAIPALIASAASTLSLQNDIWSDWAESDSAFLLSCL